MVGKPRYLHSKIAQFALYIYIFYPQSGQTGSGKTHTMLHPENGLFVLCSNEFFKRMSNENSAAGKFHLIMEFFEIYGGSLFDLFNNRSKVFAREDSKGQIQFSGLSCKRVTCIEDVTACIQEGFQCRSTGRSGHLNSSRSHAILQFRLPHLKGLVQSFFCRFTNA